MKYEFHNIDRVSYNMHYSCHTQAVIQLISLGTPVGVASGNIWLVRLATFILQPMEHTNHKFPAATAMGVSSEVKSTVGGRLAVVVQQ